MIDLKKKVLMGADALDAKGAFDPKVRAQYMNASEADSCIRQQWYQKRMPASGKPQDWGYARRGKWMEKYVTKTLQAANVPLLFGGDDQVTLYDDDASISATPDGFIVDEELGGVLGVEIKSIDPRVNRSRLPRKKHVTQLQLGMALAAGQPEFKGLPILGGVILYVDASNYNDICQHPVDYNGDILGDYAARAKKLLGTKNVDRLDREGKTSGGYECKTCPFAETCGVHAAEMGGQNRGKANRGSNLENVATTYVNLKEQETALKEAIASNGEVIKQELRARKLAKALVAGIEIDLQTVAGRSSLDRKAVAQAGIDLSPYEKTGAPSERLVVKRV